MRNSIAVFNLDHLKNGSKRPHSLISVSSSNSSSGSSGMYGGGPLSITFESPYESAYEADVSETDLPRSATICSNGLYIYMTCVVFKLEFCSCTVRILY